MSDQNINFPSSLNHSANYQDSNLNVSIPIFTIHGNHDDVIQNLSSMDLLSSTGLVNYFGKWSDLCELSISPIIFEVIMIYENSQKYECTVKFLFTEK